MNILLLFALPLASGFAPSPSARMATARPFAARTVSSRSSSSSDFELLSRRSVAKVLGAAGFAAMLPGAATAATTDDPRAAMVFEGKFTDPNHPGGFRAITVVTQGASNIPTGRATILGNDEKGAKPFLLEAKIDMETKTIKIDFSPKGGPTDVPGKWDGDGIVFPDGNKWPKVAK